MRLAIAAAEFSEDPHKKVWACVLRHDNSVGWIGWNWAPTWVDIDWSDREARRPKVIHSEANALRYIRPWEAKSIACTLLPCRSCIALIASYWIKTIYYLEEYKRDMIAHELCKEFNLELICLWW